MKYIHRILLILMTTAMIQAEEQNVLVIIKLDEKTKYVEICTDAKEWYVRAVNKDDVKKVIMVSDKDKAVGSSIVALLEKSRSKELGDGYPKALIFDNRPGKDAMYDVNSINMKSIVEQIDAELTKIQSITISGLAGQ